MTDWLQVELEVESLSRRLRLVEDELEQSRERLETSQDQLQESNKLADESDRSVRHCYRTHSLIAADAAMMMMMRMYVD